MFRDRRTRWLSVLLVCGSLVGASAYADWDYESGLSGAWRQVSEREGGDELVEEQGLVAAVTAAASVNSGDWDLSLRGGFFGGMLDYDGATQFGVPLATETEWQGWHTGAGIARDFRLPVHFRLGGGLEYEWRQRNIAATATVQGLKERYQTVWLGLSGSVRPTMSSAVVLDLACAVSSDVEVMFDGGFDDAELSLENHCRAGIAADLDIGRVGSRTLFVRPFANWERYPVTDSIRLTANDTGVGSIYLPETEFTTFGVTVGIRGRRE